MIRTSLAGQSEQPCWHGSHSKILASCKASNSLAVAPTARAHRTAKVVNSPNSHPAEDRWMPLEQSKVSCVLKGTPSLSLSGNHLGPHKFVDELLAEVTHQRSTARQLNLVLNAQYCIQSSTSRKVFGQPPVRSEPEVHG